MSGVRIPASAPEVISMVLIPVGEIKNADVNYVFRPKGNTKRLIEQGQEFINLWWV